MTRRLVVIHYPTFGGPHNQALRLDAALRDRGFESHVVLPEDGQETARYLRDRGLNVELAPLTRIRATRDVRKHLTFPAAFRRDVRRLRGIIRSRSIDLVEIAGLANAQAAIAARAEGVPVVWQILDTRTPKPLRLALRPVVGRCAPVIMTTGESLLKRMPDYARFQDRVISYLPPVDLDEFLPSTPQMLAARLELGIPAGALVVGCVCNITPQKGLESLIDVAHAVSDREDVWFVVLGAKTDTHAEYARELDERRHGLTRMIIDDPGRRVAELLPALDVFMMTAVPKSEGVSTAILEAMACEIPVISTDVGAIHEVVADGETGYLVPPGNFDGLVNRLELLTTDNVARRRMGQLARKTAESAFGVDSCAERHVLAYRTALGLVTR